MKLELNEEFKKAFELLNNTGKNVFITGKAGTGKSTFLTHFLLNTNKKTAVLAPTGVAALNVQGQTIHSFFGFKPGITISEAKQLAEKNPNEFLYKTIDLIIIDEISMVRSDLLDCANSFLKKTLNSKKPFGGKQICFIGDLYQLPPIVKASENNALRKEYESQYFFDSKTMKELELEFIEFEKVYRQTDNAFIQLLNSVRNKKISSRELEKINQRYSEKIQNDENYVYLTCTKKTAQEINNKKLENIKEKLFVFNGKTKGKFDSEHLPTETTLKLKPTAQVMFIANDSEEKWVNGTIGTISNILEKQVEVKLLNGEKVLVGKHTWEAYKLEYDSKQKTITKNTIGSFTQIPLSLAYAITIHKSQGKTFDKIILDIEKGAFAFGQLYVALSRCKSLEGIILKNKIHEKDILLDWKIIKFLTNFQYSQAQKKLSNSQKQQIIENAIKNKQLLEITYLNPSNEKSNRIIQPISIGQQEYKGHLFEALQAQCHKTREKRNFKIERILEIKKLQNS